jgi:hypothetical protein
MEFFVGMAFGVVFAGLALLADRYTSGRPGRQALNDAQRQEHFRRVAREYTQKEGG